MSELTATELAADRLVKQIVKKHLDDPRFELVKDYRNVCSLFDLVPRPYDGMMELVGFLQDPRYTNYEGKIDPEADVRKVPFRRWFTLAVIEEKKIPSLY